jgi:hypothetical protein
MNYQEITTNKPYNGLDDIQLKINNVPGMEIVANSLELDGILRILVNGAPIADANDVYWDHLIGAHCLISQTSEKVNGRILSNNLNYPRYVKMLRNAKMESTNVGCQSDTVRELCAANYLMTQPLLVGNAGAVAFSLKPYLSVNNTNRNLTYQDVQTLEIDINLSDKSIFFGETAVVNTITLSITNLKLRYKTQPAGKYNGPVIYPIIGYKVFDISSNQSSNDILTPINTSFVMSSFNIPQDPAANDLDNPVRLLNPNATKIKYLYNDMNNVGVSFELLSQEEMLMQYLLAVGNMNSNDISPQTVQVDEDELDGTCFCVANSVGMLPPKTKITYQYSTDAGERGIKYQVYTYFLGEVAL